MWPKKCQRCTDRSLECSENRTTKSELNINYPVGLIDNNLDVEVQDLYVAPCTIPYQRVLNIPRVDLHYLLFQQAQVIADVQSIENLQFFDEEILEHSEAVDEARKIYRSKLDGMIELCKEKRMSALMYLLHSLPMPVATGPETRDSDIAIRARRDDEIIDFINAKASNLVLVSFKSFIASSWTHVFPRKERQQTPDKALVQIIQKHDDFTKRVPGMQTRLSISTLLKPTPLLCQSGLNTFIPLLKQLSENDQMLAGSDSMDRTPLHCIFDDETPASFWHHLGWYKFPQHALDRETQINRKDIYGRTILHVACEKGLPDHVVAWLLEKGGNLQVEDALDRSPLLIAAAYGRASLVKLLLDEKARTDCIDCFNRTPLSRSAEIGAEATVQLLLIHGADVDIPDEDGLTPLHYAAGEGHLSVAALLLDAGADLSIADGDGETSLLLAAKRGHKAVVKLLLDAGAAVNFADESGLTPLLYAIVGEHEAVAKLLLDYKADVDLPAADWTTPLMYASRIGHEAFTKLLLAARASVDLKDRRHWTALFWAAKYGHESIVRLLLDAGANADLEDVRGRKALDLAVGLGFDAVVSLLT